MESSPALIPIEAPAPLAAARETSAPARPSVKATRGLLSLQGVWKIFPASRVPILSDVTLECRPGEFVVVVGPSGCGKTTLLNVAAGMAIPERGTVQLDGEPVKSPGPQRAMVFQEHGLFPWLTAEQNVAFGLKMAGVAKSERDDRVVAALRMVHLSGSGRKLVHELSGGMRQRIAIARALVMDPAVLLMDEPFASLDAQTRTLLHQQLQDLWGQTKKTILFVTHSVGEAVRLADRIIVLHAHPGRIRAEIGVNLPHPRQLDSPAMSELARRVRKEIEDEVNRVNAAAQEFWQPPSSVDLDSGPGGMGDGI
ncbi:MAG: ABC transporter ATP-binding protein [Tepidisphaeraceae bacterium]|jgi:NitT/TauT family transport system ATP-binding protein